MLRAGARTKDGTRFRSPPVAVTTACVRRWHAAPRNRSTGRHGSYQCRAQIPSVARRPAGHAQHARPKTARRARRTGPGASVRAVAAVHRRPHGRRAARALDDVFEDFNLLRQAGREQVERTELFAERRDHRARLADQECMRHRIEPRASHAREEMVRHLLLVLDPMPPGRGSSSARRRGASPIRDSRRSRRGRGVRCRSHAGNGHRTARRRRPCLHGCPRNACTRSNVTWARPHGEPQPARPRTLGH